MEKKERERRRERENKRNRSREVALRVLPGPSHLSVSTLRHVARPGRPSLGTRRDCFGKFLSLYLGTNGGSFAGFKRVRSSSTTSATLSGREKSPNSESKSERIQRKDFTKTKQLLKVPALVVCGFTLGVEKRVGDNLFINAYTEEKPERKIFFTWKGGVFDQK